MHSWISGMQVCHQKNIEIGSLLSISSTEDDMCCLDCMAEETLRTVGTNKPISPTVEANASIFNRRKGSSYIPAERQHVFKILSLTGLACLPRGEDLLVGFSC